MAHKTKFKSRRDARATESHNAKGSGGIGDKQLTVAKADVPVPPASVHTGERAMPWIVGIIALLVYMGTMTPAMQMGDGTELATAASVLGVPHPTGYPLYMLLCKLWLIITMGGEVITRTTLLNCIMMAGAAGLTSVIIKDALRKVWRAEVSKALLVTAGLAGLLTAFLRFHWQNATVTEVYALQFLLTVVFVRIVQKMDLAGGPTRRGLLWLTVVFALAIAHHRLSVTLILPWLGVWLWAWQKGGNGGTPLGEMDVMDNMDQMDKMDVMDKMDDGKSKAANPHPGKKVQDVQDVHSVHPFHPAHPRPTAATLAIALLILIAGAALYLYIPLRAAQQPPVNWGNATTWSAFYNHVRGTEYLDRGLLKPGLGQEFSGNSAQQFFMLQSQQILGDLAGQVIEGKEVIVPGPPGSQKIFILFYAGIFGGIILLGFACWGYLRAVRCQQLRLAALVIIAIAAQNIGVLYVYNIADIRDYYLFPFWAAVVGLSFVYPAPRPRRFTRELGIYILAGLVFGAWASNYQRCNRINDLYAELLSATILPESTDVMPSGSILITDDDAETFTTWYRQIVRGNRPDVLNFAGNFVYMPWYSAFFTEEQRRDFQITLAPGVARSADEYARQLRTAIIDKNAEAHPVFTSINDPVVLTILSNDYEIKPVDAVEVVNPLYDQPTTHVLYRISPK